MGPASSLAHHFDEPEHPLLLYSLSPHSLNITSPKSYASYSPIAHIESDNEPTALYCTVVLGFVWQQLLRLAVAALATSLRRSRSYY